ncbi:endonuclease/exonuclease/phosphatase family protein [Anaerotignum sp. MB30-C6]|uniref:endonuclease/exonuclease/phosphatase family protein n=1 Tax=Anaerotignum sp. MB30-C6 TaxID=3070814 RepID=UPI0027DBDE89|nr:endonuclease/exonuclease/phosphatase family protein [Anaerotignum sp. MB30-C6]WMI80660.1 endonuclease/exonuclease/phosphatase family protein [Anaerotignum sp. MB30-C6]
MSINWKKKTMALVGVILIGIVIYLLYVILSYKRIKDNQPLEINQNSTIESIKMGEVYRVMTYNIGFGAYTPEYSFFMDGGKSSVAESKDKVLGCINGSAQIAKEFEPDFLLLQEVDLDATRSYHVNQKEIFDNVFSEYDNQSAIIYNSAFLFYPIWEPHGKSLSTIAVYSRYQIDSALRRSLPISEGFNKFLDLDRCYTKSQISVENGKFLCLYNVHLSAYGNDASIRSAQIEMLVKDMEQEYKDGNYIVCGGDFNHDLLSMEDDLRNELPETFHLAGDLFPQSKIMMQAKSSRANDIPFDPEKSFVVTLDGFIVSENIEVLDYTVSDEKFAYSDHNPVTMQFKLKT